MRSITSQLTNEMETLVHRAMRQGFLDPADLLGTFTELNLLPEDGAERIEMLSDHLKSLPPPLFLASEVTLVHKLSSLPYPEEPHNASSYPCAWQEEGEHLLIEMAYGSTSVLHFATHLSFLSQYYLECLESHGAPGQFAHQAPKSPEEMAPLLELSPSRLTELLTQTDQRLLKLLRGELTFPEIHIHTSLSPESIAAEFEKDGLSILKDITELGLHQRPLYLWIGNDLPTYFLSPYLRDLKEELLHWASGSPPEAGSDLRSPDPTEDTTELLYALAIDFLNSDETLRAEFEEVNRDAGIIHRRVAGEPYEIIDLGRLDYDAIDPRIPPHRPTERPPVLLRLPHLLGDSDGQVLRTLTTALGKKIKGITVAMNGRHLGHPPGSLLNPDLILRWAGKRKIPIPARSALCAHRPQNSGGVLLTIPCSLLISNDQLNELSEELRVTGLTIGFGGLLEALADSLWSGLISPNSQLFWPLISLETNAEGRASLASLAGWADLIVSIVGPWIGERKHPAPKPTRSPTPPKKTASPAQPPRFPPPSAAAVVDLKSGPVLPPPDFDTPDQPPAPAPNHGRPLRIKV